MNALDILRLVATALSPAALAFLFHLITRKNRYWLKLNYWLQQVLIGVFFALLAMCSFYFGVKYQPVTETSVEIYGTYGSATASPVIAGLVFGWPAGLISGFVAAIIRLVMYPFGVGDYLRVAECLSVFFAGSIASLLRFTLFDNKKPKWGYGIIIGLLVETIHMVCIFITGLSQRDVNFAYAVIKQCDIPCAIVVTCAILIALISIAILEKEKLFNGFKRNNKIAAKIQRWMLISFIFAMLGASLLTYFACSTNASVETHQVLENAARDVVYELETSPWGSESGWNFDQNIGPTDLNSELRPIAYTRRIRTNGWISIVGDSSNYGDSSITDKGNKSPVNIVQDTIYSCSADLSEYVGATFKFRNPKKPNETFSPSDDKVLTSTIRMDTSLMVPGIDPNLFIHRSSPMLETILYSSDNVEYHYVAVVIQAKVTGVDNKTITQTFNVVALLSIYEAQMSLGLSLRIATYIELFVFIAVYGVIYTFIKRAVINNIQKVNNSLEEITHGNLNTKVDVRSNEEFASLSDDINSTVDTLKRYIDEANRRINDELTFAKEIQHGSLTNVFPMNENYDLYATMDTAKEVGGDFYDFFMVDKERLMILIADVSGKGIPAAMFMMRAKALIKSYVNNQNLKLNEVVMKVNNELCVNNTAMMFVTGWFGILNINTGVLEFSNAGHNPPLVKQNGKFAYLKMNAGLVLAGMEDIPYKLETITLQPGDEIFLYTDGVTEATSVKVQLYGEERLLNLINAAQYESARGLLETVKKDVDLFQSGAIQADDITMLAVRYKPKATFEPKHIKIRPRLDEIIKIIDFVNECLRVSNVDQKTISRIDIGLDEIISNVVLRSYHNQAAEVEVIFELRNGVSTITIIDNGKPSNPIENINRAKPGLEITEANIPTIGLLLVKQTLHSVEYQFKDNKNVLIIKKQVKL